MCLAGLTEVRQAAAEQEAGKAAGHEASSAEAAGFFDKILVQQRRGVELPQKTQQTQFPQNAYGTAAALKATSPVAAAKQPVPVPATPEATAEDSSPASTPDTSMLEKTKMCKFFAAGQCIRGEACSFAHSKRQLRPQPNLYRTRVCLDFASGDGCAFGDKCKYAHSEEEVRPETMRKPTKHSGASRKRAQGERAKLSASQIGLAQELEVVKRQTEQLRAQLEELQSQVAMGSVVPEQPPSEGNTTESDCFSGGSRRGRSSGPSTSGDTSTASGDEGGKMEWKGSASSWSETPEPEEDEQQEVVVSVKNTFLNLVPRHGTSALRRARST